MAFTQKQLEYIEKLKKKKEEAKKKRTQKWHEAGVKARARNKKKRDAKKEKEKEKERLKKEALKEKKKLEAKKKKRGPGRPKKRGPKKKKKYISKKPKVNKRRLCDFKIVAVLNGKQKEYIGNFSTAEEAYAKLNELKEESAKVVFPRKVINAGALKESKDEYLILRKNRDGNLTDSQLRNEYGKFVEHTSNSNVWVIYDKCDRLVEETFWVYGHCPKTDRKTFEWVYNNLLIDKLDEPHVIERVILYKNKIVIKHDEKPIDFVVCKNISDSIRFYNLLEEWCKKNRQVFFLGSYSRISDKRRELEKELIDLTGWDKRKIQYPSTRA
jgi:hypothetical protein